MEPDNSINNHVNVPANSKEVMTKLCSDCSAEQSVFMFPEIISLCHTSNEQTGNPNTEIVNDRNIISVRNTEYDKDTDISFMFTG